MRVLLDTHIIIWAAKNMLSPTAQELFADTANTFYYSPLSLWEISLKQKNLKVDVAELRTALQAAGYLELNVTSWHVLSLAKLPIIHNDPFDRMLIAQAQAEGVLLLTDDKTVQDYSAYVDCILAYE